jgi:ERCC4-type nuclease
VLLIDDREPKRLRERICAGLENCSSKRMAVGDYLLFDKCGHILGVERKAVDDLLSSIPQGKLKRQVGALREFDRHLLLVQGIWHLTPEGKVSINNRASAWMASTVQMILLGLQRFTGVHLLWVSCEDELIQTIQALVRQGQKRCWLDEKGDS